MAERKLPVQQLTILSLCRFAEPIALTSVFPYLPEMIESFGVAENEIAKWAGIATAIFSICQCLTGIPWGRASDQFGRKYIILLGLTNTLITSLLWGFSTSLPMALTARALAGAGNGNVGIIRTMVAEMCPWRELQPRAFSIMPLVWNIGSIFGPAFGGALSNPLRQDPRKPRGSSFLEKYPYALPNVVAASLFFIGIVIGFLFLHETLETRKNKPDYGLILGQKLKASVKGLFRPTKGPSSAEQEPLLKPSDSRYLPPLDEESSLSDVDSALTPSRRPGFREVLTYQSVLNLIVYTILALYAIGYDQLIPVFMHHPPHGPENPPRQLPLRFSNGFGLQSGRIGLLFTLYGATGMVVQFFVFPPVARRYGVLRCLRVCTCILPCVFFLTPFTALLPNVKLQQAAIFLLMISKGSCSTFMFPCSTILLTNSASSLRILGTLNGIATSVSAIGRAAGPALGGATFTLGVKHNLVIAPFWIFATISALSTIPVFMLEEGAGFDNDEETEDDDDDDVNVPKPAADILEDGAVGPEVLLVPHDDQIFDSEISFGSPHQTAMSRTSTRSTTFNSIAVESDADDDESRLRLPRAWTHHADHAEQYGLEGTSDVGGGDAHGGHRPQKRRRSSVPVGGANLRKLSSNLGQSRSGYGCGTLGP